MRPKPTVADTNRANALANVETKKTFLTLATLMMSSGEPRTAEDFELTARLAASLPTSARQFNSWTSESFEGWGESDWPVFTRNAQKTLIVNCKLEIIQRNIDAALATRTQFLAAPDQAKQDRVSRLKARLRQREKLLEISEEALKSELEKNGVLRSKAAALQNQIVKITEEFQKRIQEKDREIANSRKASGDLKVVMPFIKRGD